MTSAETRRPLFAANAVFAALLAWVYGRELWLVWEVQAAPAAALRELPSLGLIGAGLGCALLGVGVVAVAALARRPAAWAGFRVVPIAALLVFFVDFGVLGSRRLLGTPEQLAQLAVVGVAERAETLATTEGLPDDAGVFLSFAEDLGSPPYFVHGAQVAKWAVEVRGGCSGLVADAGAVSPGTVIYCLSADRRRGWVWVVGLKLGERLGAPAVVSLEEPYVAVVQAPPGDSPDAGR